MILLRMLQFARIAVGIPLSCHSVPVARNDTFELKDAWSDNSIIVSFRTLAEGEESQRRWFDEITI